MMLRRMRWLFELKILGSPMTTSPRIEAISKAFVRKL